MSGFLRRLVERTLRPTAAVHSQARLPFAPPILDAVIAPLEQPAESAPPLPPATAAAPPAAPLWEAPDPPSANPGLQRPPAASLATARPPAGAPPAPLVARQPESGPDPSVSLDGDRIARPALTTAAPNPRRSFSPLLAAAPVEPEANLDRPEPLATAAESPTSPTAWRAFPTEPVVARPPPVALDRRRPPAEPESGDDAATVHVTIGRIDITAVHAPPPAKPKPAPARQPQSLEEYLAQRNRGRA